MPTAFFFNEFSLKKTSQSILGTFFSTLKKNLSLE